MDETCFQWASLHRTTRPEDIASSLFGTFYVTSTYLPGDISVLDSVEEATSLHSCFSSWITSGKCYRVERKRTIINDESGPYIHLGSVAELLMLIFFTSFPVLQCTVHRVTC
ncbi:hypothetical protein EDD16DRAFT_1599449 [Pisolithus croceorrhizus]|nr:hypothetical protein EDD16DRAFT_1599449 [Pisolithus croceorrhizus]KAI6133852.1 hypothetical protein EV401DRAFT_1911771 [Pisolithus croceorrhizus]KAI6161937.1 hypothetical protein EDD17DRAFT_606253 [Pisolithus thermaeus]